MRAVGLLREQIIDNIIKTKVKAGMTDIEKITAVLTEITNKTYNSTYGSTDGPLLEGHGNCVTSSYDGLLCLQRMGYTARMRNAERDGLAGHMNLYLLLDNELYIVDCQAGRGTPLVAKANDLDSSGLTVIGEWTRSQNLVADNDFVYKILDDGTVSIYDVVGLSDVTKRTGKVWTVPTSVTVNGKTYKVSDLRLTGYEASRSTLYDDWFELYGVWDEIIIPKGITYVNESAFTTVQNGKSVCSTKITYLDKDNVEKEHAIDRTRVWATCTEEGYYTDTCIICGEVVKEYKTAGYTTPALGHDYKTTVVAPTATSQGSDPHSV